MKIKLLKTEADYNAALERISKLMDCNCKHNTPDGDELELLSIIVSDYEEKHYPIGPPTAIGAIEFYMDQRNLKPKDMVQYFGTRKKVLEILSGKRHLTLGMMRKLHTHLDIPLDVLVTDILTTKGRAKTPRKRKSSAKSTSSVAAKQKSSR